MDMKKIYEKPIIERLAFKDPLLDLGGLSVINKNTADGGQDLTIGVGDDEGNIWNDARAKNFNSIWEEDAFTGHIIPDEVFE